MLMPLSLSIAPRRLRMPAHPPPVGWMFAPTDEDLLFYLHLRADGQPIPSGTIVDCDVYQAEPWNLPTDEFSKEVREGEFFYFTSRHPAAAECPVRRAAGSGYWEGDDRIEDVHYFDDPRFVVCQKMALTFKWEDKVKGMATVTNWNMEEFLLPSAHIHFQKLALCKIYYRRDESEYDSTDAFLFKPHFRKRRKTFLEIDSEGSKTDGSLGQKPSSTLGHQDFPHQ